MARWADSGNELVAKQTNVQCSLLLVIMSNSQFTRSEKREIEKLAFSLNI